MPKKREKFTLDLDPDYYREVKIINHQQKKPTKYFMEIHIDKILPSPDQTRDKINPDKVQELAENIRRTGLLHPIVVRPHPDSTRHEWLLISGEHRLEAAKFLGWSMIRAHVIEDMDDLQAYLATLSENVMRNPYKADEEAKAIERGRAHFGLSNAELAEKMGLSEKRVMQLYRALKLPIDLRERLDEAEKLTHRHIEAFRLIIGNAKITTMALEDNDSEEVRKIKNLIHALLSEVIDDDLSGEQALIRAKELLKPHRNKTFLSPYLKRIKYKIKQRPQKMSAEKRRLLIYQAKDLISALEEMVAEEEAKLAKT